MLLDKCPVLQYKALINNTIKLTILLKQQSFTKSSCSFKGGSIVTFSLYISMKVFYCIPLFVYYRNSSFPQGLSQYAAMANSLTRQLSISHSRQPSQDIPKHHQLLEDDGNSYLSLSPPSSSELVLRRRGNTPERHS